MESKYTLNDLPIYNPWVKRLLGFEDLSVKSKNERELKREYEDEKWGVLLKKISENETITIESVDDIAFDRDSINFCFYKDEFFKCTYGELHTKYIDLVYNTISPYLPASAIVELGSGYGTILFNLAKRHLEKAQLLIGAEFAESGVEIMKRLASFEDLNFIEGQCNFYDLCLDHLRIPEGSVLFTSYATTCIPELENSFLDAIIKVKPKVVVHFEPLFQQYGDDLLSLLRKKYILSNDYNKNLLSLVKDHAGIDIKFISSPQIGINPLLCPSILLWQPKEMFKI